MPSSATSPTNPDQLSNKEKLLQALKLRRGGATFEQIVEAGLYSYPSAAHRAIKNHYEKLNQRCTEEAGALRAEEVDRLDAILRSLWSTAMNSAHANHLVAVDRVIKVMQHRAKLLGLEAPTKMEHTGEDGSRLMPDTLFDPTNLTEEQMEIARELMRAARGGNG